MRRFGHHHRAPNRDIHLANENIPSLDNVLGITSINRDKINLNNAVGKEDF